MPCAVGSNLFITLFGEEAKAYEFYPKSYNTSNSYIIGYNALIYKVDSKGNKYEPKYYSLDKEGKQRITESTCIPYTEDGNVTVYAQW